VKDALAAAPEMLRGRRRFVVPKFSANILGDIDTICAIDMYVTSWFVKDVTTNLWRNI